MVDHRSVGRCVSVIGSGLCDRSMYLAISATALGAAQDGPAVAYSTNDVGMQFASVPAGQFPMGCSEGVKPVECGSEEKPRHTVQITKGFELGKTEVTQKQWQAVMGSNPSQHKGDDLPVEEVTFQDVQAFLTQTECAQRRISLPAANRSGMGICSASWHMRTSLAGAKVANSLGRYSPADDWAWYNVEETKPVATKKPNAWGLYDMRGNVNEWVQDWYDSKYYAKSPMADPKGPDTDAAEGGRGVRGGSFHDDGPWLTRVSLRQHFPEDYKHFDLGFRVVREKR